MLVTGATSLDAGSRPAGWLSCLDVPLLASNGAEVAPRGSDGETLVLYFFPGTGVSPEDGLRSEAHDLSQHLSFASYDLAFRSLGCRVLGISTQAHERQAHYAEKARTRHLLLSDPELTLAAALHLRTFSTGLDDHFYARSLLIVPRDAEVVILNVGVPGECPVDALAWLRAQGS